MHSITFKVSSTDNKQNVSSVVVTTVTYKNGREFTLNPIYFANELGESVTQALVFFYFFIHRVYKAT